MTMILVKKSLKSVADELESDCQPNDSTRARTKKEQQEESLPVIGRLVLFKETSLLETNIF